MNGERLIFGQRTCLFNLGCHQRVVQAMKDGQAIKHPLDVHWVPLTYEFG